ncbi:hypothetical protein [Haliangium sp.]|uniref:hypothetical protein n=1 Tax=Haliangium sp. TaxID=2663208 RepID=UPI003D13467D
MLAYEELVTALARWREREGLPPGAPEYASALPARTATADDAREVTAPVLEDDYQLASELPLEGHAPAPPTFDAVELAEPLADAQPTGAYEPLALEDVDHAEGDHSALYGADAGTPPPPPFAEPNAGGDPYAASAYAAPQAEAPAVGYAPESGPHPMEPVYDGGQGHGLPPQDPYAAEGYQDYGQDQAYAQPGEQPYGHDQAYAQPGEQPYGHDQAYAQPVDQPYGHDQAYAQPGEQPYGHDQAYAQPVDQPYGHDQAYAQPADQPYGHDQAYAQPGEQPYGHDQAYAQPGEQPYAHDQAYSQPADQAYGYDPAYAQQPAAQAYGQDQSYAQPGEAQAYDGQGYDANGAPAASPPPWPPDDDGERTPS